MQDFKLLYEKYLEGKSSPEEIEQLMKHFEVSDTAVLAEMIDETLDTKLTTGNDKSEIETLLARNHISVMKAVRKKGMSVSLYIKILAAAIVTLVIGYIFLVLTGTLRPVTRPSGYGKTIEVLPGGNRATLTLSDGRTINLTDATNGKLVTDQGAAIEKTADGQIIYTPTDMQPLSSLYNKVSTPRGGQYAVLLPDGSKVWLNAGSSLRYPVSFYGLKERRIELEGEAYFVVAKDKFHPFIVSTKKQTVTVLGTHFNINGYSDEPYLVTTLEEGKVKVESGGVSLNISPGEKTVLSSEGNMEVQHADLESALAWKNGKIYFKDADIKSIMRQVSRWYNIDVEFEGKLSAKLYSGGIYRDAKLSNLLEILEENKIHFELTEPVKGKKLLTVRP
ncbi:FecR family protein [Pedobacter borealis]|uniref:FecR family protein n=1 Tax=Pedobacter borealis TaxID=475254 RepID=UPI000493AD40|nr:FecR family protein [Pedobacter borealis]